MIIDTIKRQEEDGELVGYLLNDKSSVPLDEDNRHYRAILEWIKEGNIPEPADLIIPPDTTKKDEALARLKERAKSDINLADLLTVLSL